MTAELAKNLKTYKGFLNHLTTDSFKKSKGKLAQDAQMYFNGSKPIHAMLEDQNVNVFKIDDTGLVCLDTDDQESFEYIESLMKKHKIDISKLKAKSVSNHFRGDEGINKYKFHYWFKTDKVIEKNIGVNESHLDILTKEIVFEPITNEGIEAYNFAIPLTNELYEDALKIRGGNANKQSKIQFQKVDKDVCKNIVLTDSSIPLEEIKFIDDNTNAKDANDFKKWRKVIFKIANKYGKTELGLKLSHYFSAKCKEKYVDNEIDMFYHGIKMDKIQECIFGLSDLEMKMKKESIAEEGRKLLQQTIESDKKQKQKQKEQEAKRKESLKNEKDKEKELFKSEKTKERELSKTDKIKENESLKAEKLKEKESLKNEIIQRKIESMDETEKAYFVMKTEFEIKRAKIIASGFYAEIFGISDDVKMFSKKQMYDKYCHLSHAVDEKGKPVSFIARWIDDPKIKFYDDIDIYPKRELCPSNVYNLWRDFAMEKVKEYTEDKVGLEQILNHIKILCNHDEIGYKQLIVWMAHMIQHPEQRSICPTIISAEGTGKTTLYLWLEKILGKDKCFKTSKPMLHLFGNFNSAILNKILIFLDDPEVTNPNTFNEMMKDHITAETAEIHRKGESVYVTKAFHRDFICTNNRNGLLKEEKGGSRRNLTLTASDEKVGESTYFAELYALRDSIDSMKTFYEYLKTLPNIPLVLEKPIKSNFQNEITALTKMPLQLWLEEFVGLEYINLEQKAKRIEKGNSMNEVLQEGDFKVTLRISEILQKYSEFCTKNKFNYMNENAVKIGVSLFHLKRDMKLDEDTIESKHTKTGNKQTFNVTKLADALGIAELDDDDEDEVEEVV